MICSDAEGNAVKVEAANGAMGDNMTDSGNATETSLCSTEKKPEATQECGASSTEEGDPKPTEESTAEVSYIIFLVD